MDIKEMQEIWSEIKRAKVKPPRCKQCGKKLLLFTEEGRFIISEKEAKEQGYSIDECYQHETLDIAIKGVRSFETTPN